MKPIRWRDQSSVPSERRVLRKNLRVLHQLEIMAVNIYQYQIGTERTDLQRELIEAMQVEMRHTQDFQVALFEYGLKPSPTRWAYWLMGWFLGVFSRIRGIRAVLRMGIWVESKAVDHYTEILAACDWEPDLRAVIEHNQNDEYHHIELWQKFLQAME